MAIETINPVNGELIKHFDQYNPDQVDRILRQSAKTWDSWKETSFEYRAGLMRNLGDYVADNVDRLGKIITLEMGKPIVQARAEIRKCAAVCYFYADNAEKFLAPRIIPTEAVTSYVRYDPLGPVLAVMPWNFPFWQVFRFAAPALMAGNVGVLKHASNVPMAALEMEKLFLEAGFPEGAFSTLLIGAGAAEKVIRDPRIVAVTLTGSEVAGRAVASAAGSVLKKTVLELGGSDPWIILEDADLDKAAEVATIGRTMNTGQSCIAAKRFIVHNTVIEDFSEKFKSRLAALKVGDPMDDSTDVGPMARPDLRNDLHSQVERSLKEGATLELGGKIPEGPGNFYPVTLLGKVKPLMVAGTEETFGPLAPLITVDSDDEAIRIANDSIYGLGGSIWSRDIDRAQEIARRVETGAVFINGLTRSDNRVPFGGIKNSGYGRELSEEGIREFMNAKTVWVEE